MTGMVRSHNEDSIASDADKGLVVLADGMGGYNAGEVASGMATTVITTELQQMLEEHTPFEIDPQSGQSVVVWKDGALPRAMRNGHWLLLDELDAAPVFAALQQWLAQKFANQAV